MSLHFDRCLQGFLESATRGLAAAPNLELLGRTGRCLCKIPCQSEISHDSPAVPERVCSCPERTCWYGTSPYNLHVLHLYTKVPTSIGTLLWYVSRTELLRTCSSQHPAHSWQACSGSHHPRLRLRVHAVPVSVGQRDNPCLPAVTTTRRPELRKDSSSPIRDHLLTGIYRTLSVKPHLSARRRTNRSDVRPPPHPSDALPVPCEVCLSAQRGTSSRKAIAPSRRLGTSQVHLVYPPIPASSLLRSRRFCAQHHASTTYQYRTVTLTSLPLQSGSRGLPRSRPDLRSSRVKTPSQCTDNIPGLAANPPPPPDLLCHTADLTVRGKAHSDN